MQVILRVCLLRLGTVKQRKGFRQKSQDHRHRSEPTLGCLDSGKEVTEAKGGPLETGSVV